VQWIALITEVELVGERVDADEEKVKVMVKMKAMFPSKIMIKIVIRAIELLLSLPLYPCTLCSYKHCGADVQLTYLIATEMAEGGRLGY